MSSMDFPASYKPKSDLLKAVTVSTALLGGAAIINHSWVAENQNLAMVAVFTAGYMGIVFEEFLAFNKSGVALLMAVSLWVILSLGVKPSKPLLSPSLFSFQAFQKFSRKCRVSRKSAWCS
jgi:hypothetical protein